MSKACPKVYKTLPTDHATPTRNSLGHIVDHKKTDAERRPFFSNLSHFRATPMTAARPPAIVPMQERYAPTPIAISPEATPISALSR